MEINFSKEEKVTIIDRNVRFPKALPVFSLEYLVKVNNDEIDWSSVNSSWVISRELQGRRVLIAVRNKNIFKNYGRAGTMDPIEADFNLELEAVEVGDKTICLDVISVYGISVESKTLAQRLACITEKMAQVLNIECQRYYTYDENTVKMVNDSKVVNYVIQNSLDVYKCQRKRFTRITIDDKFNESDYQVETEMVYESTYEVQDVIEIRSVVRKAVEGGASPDDEVPDVIQVDHRKNGLFGHAKPQEFTYILPKKIYDIHKDYENGIPEINKKKFKKIFKRISDIGLDPVIGFSNYDVCDRVLQKQSQVIIDNINKADSKNLKRKRKKN
jgi:hypothetical protein